MARVRITRRRSYSCRCPGYETAARKETIRRTEKRQIFDRCFGRAATAGGCGISPKPPLDGIIDETREIERTPMRDDGSVATLKISARGICGEWRGRDYLDRGSASPRWPDGWTSTGSRSAARRGSLSNPGCAACARQDAPGVHRSSAPPGCATSSTRSRAAPRPWDTRAGVLELQLSRYFSILA